MAVLKNNDSWYGFLTKCRNLGYSCLCVWVSHWNVKQNNRRNIYLKQLLGCHLNSKFRVVQNDTLNKQSEGSKQQTGKQTMSLFCLVRCNGWDHCVRPTRTSEQIKQTNARTKQTKRKQASNRANQDKLIASHIETGPLHIFPKVSPGLAEVVAWLGRPQRAVCILIEIVFSQFQTTMCTWR